MTESRNCSRKEEHQSINPPATPQARKSPTESSKLLLAKSIAEPLGLPTPDYTPSKGVLRSCAELLKEHAAKLSPQQFNQRMIQHGYMAELTRPSSKGSVKKFKSIIGDGLQYGENQVNPNNPKSTQPLYYADKFGELMNLLSAN